MGHKHDKDKHHNKELAHLKDLKEVRSLEGDIIKLKQKKEVLELELEDLRLEFDKECAYLKKVLTEERVALEKELQYKKERSEQKYKNEIKQLEEQLFDVNKKKNYELGRLESKIQDKKHVIKNIQNNIAQLTQDQISINQQIADDMQEHNELIQAIYDLQKKAQEYKDKLTSENEQYNHLITKSQALFNKVENSQVILNNFKHEAALLKRRTKIKFKESKKLSKDIQKQSYILKHNKQIVHQSNLQLSSIKVNLKEKQKNLGFISDELKRHQDVLQETLEKNAFVEVSTKELLSKKKETQKYLESIGLEKLSYESKLRVLKEEFEYGQKKLLELKNEKSNLETSIQFLSNKKSKLKEKIDENELSLEELENKSNALFEEVEYLNKELETKQYLEKTFSNEITELENKKTELSPIVHQLETKNKNLSQAQVKLKENIKHQANEVVTLNNKQFALKEEIERIKQVKEGLYLEVEKAQDQVDELHQDVKSHDQVIVLKEQKLEEIKETKEKLEKDIESIQAQAFEFENKVQNIIEQFEVTSKNHQEKLNQVESLNQQIKQIEDRHEQVNQDFIKNENEKKEQIAHLDSEYQNKKEELENKAQDQATSIVSKAQQESSKIVEKAQAQAKEITDRAQVKAQEVIKQDARSLTEEKEKFAQDKSQFEEQREELKEKVFNDILSQLKADISHDQIERLEMKEDYQGYFNVIKMDQKSESKVNWFYTVASSAAMFVLFLGSSFIYKGNFFQTTRNLASVVAPESSEPKLPEMITMTSGYTQTWQDKQFQDSLKVELSQFLKEELNLSEHLSVVLVSHEFNFVQSVARTGQSITKDNREIELQKLKVLEIKHKNNINKILREPAHYPEYKKFIKDYYIKYQNERK